MAYGITHFEKEPLIDGSDLLTFSFKGHSFKVEAFDFGGTVFRIVDIKVGDSLYGVDTIREMLEALQLENDDSNNLRNQDHESDAKDEAKENQITLEEE